MMCRTFPFVQRTSLKITLPTYAILNALPIFRVASWSCTDVGSTGWLIFVTQTTHYYGIDHSSAIRRPFVGNINIWLHRKNPFACDDNFPWISLISKHFLLHQQSAIECRVAHKRKLNGNLYIRYTFSSSTRRFKMFSRARQHMLLRGFKTLLRR